MDPGQPSSRSNPTRSSAARTSFPPCRGLSRWIKILQPGPPLGSAAEASHLAQVLAVGLYPTATTSTRDLALWSSRSVEVIAVGLNPAVMTSASANPSPAQIFHLVEVIAVRSRSCGHDLPFPFLCHAQTTQPSLASARGHWIKIQRP